MISSGGQRPSQRSEKVETKISEVLFNFTEKRIKKKTPPGVDGRVISNMDVIFTEEKWEWGNNDTTTSKMSSTSL